MSKIQGKNTQPELALRKALFARGYRYRKNLLGLPGKPDIVMAKYKLVVNVNGCFWHGHDGCKYFKLPNTRSEWWKTKIEKTKERDQINEEQLKSLGWNVLTVWECEIKKCVDDVVKKIEARI